MPIAIHMDAKAKAFTPNEMAGLRRALINAASPMKNAMPGKMNTVIIKNRVGKVSADTMIDVTAMFTAFPLVMGGLMVVSAMKG